LDIECPRGIEVTKELGIRNKIQRQNQIKRFLSHTSEASALSLSEITERLISDGFEVNRKTVERDIEEFSIMYPLLETSSYPRKFYFDGGFKLDFELVFDENQLQTIVLALGSLQQMAPNVVKELCLEVETTLVSKLPKVLSEEFEHLKSISNHSSTILGEGSEIDNDVFQTVITSLRKGKVFECQYDSSGERNRLFAPLKLHFVGSPYIYVYDCADNVIKLLRISRIHHAHLTDLLVDRKRVEDIKLDFVFGGYGSGKEKIINYHVLCTKQMATRFMEQRIHKTQVIKKMKDDLFEISFSVHDSDEITRLLAQYGECIKSISPEEEYEKVKTIWRSGLKVG